MKKNRNAIFLTTLAVFSAVASGRISRGPSTDKATCPGYTIIEYGKGINCYGDTVVLTRKEGLQVLALGH